MTASSSTAKRRAEIRPDQKRRLERMIAEQYRLIWRLLRRLGVPEHTVDDATQQVFLIAAERLDDIREDSERAFAYGTALRVAHGFRRRSAREPLRVEVETSSPEPGPDALAEQRRTREQLDRVLLGLSIELRTVFVLFELEGLTSPEIAELAGVPLGTVASRLRRAREQFRALVAREVASKEEAP